MAKQQQQVLLPNKQAIDHESCSSASPKSSPSPPLQQYENGETTTITTIATTTTTTTSPNSPTDTALPPTPPTPAIKPTHLPEPDFTKSLTRVFLPFPLQTPYPELIPSSPTRCRRPRHRRHNHTKLAEASRRWQDSYGHFPGDSARSASTKVRWASRLVEFIGRSDMEMEGEEETLRMVTRQRERRLSNRVERRARRGRLLADIRREEALIREERDGWNGQRLGSGGSMLWSPLIGEGRRASTGEVPRRRMRSMMIKKVVRRSHGSI